MALGTLIGLLMFAYAAMWVLVAYYVDQTLLPEQMMRRFGTAKVIPLVVDLFVLADIVCLPFILRLMANENGAEWTFPEVLLWSLIGLAASFSFQLGVVMTGEHPAVLGWKGGITSNGWLHIPYFAAAVAIIGLYCTKVRLEPSVTIAFRTVPEGVGFVVGLLLIVQSTLDLHVPMKYAQQALHLPWYPDVFASDPKQFWMLAGVFVFTMLGTLATAGLFPFFAVSVAAMVWIAAITTT